MSEPTRSAGLAHHRDAAGPDDSGVVFRPGTTADVPRIADYYHRCWLEASASSLQSGIAERLDASMWLELFGDRLAPDSPMRTVVATHEGAVIGHVQVQGHHLVHLFIDPDHQGAGLGRRMLGIGEQLILAAGYADGELHTRVDNERALELYASAGWRLTDQLIHSADHGIEYDEHVLVKYLVGEQRTDVSRSSPS